MDALAQLRFRLLRTRLVTPAGLLALAVGCASPPPAPPPPAPRTAPVITPAVYQRAERDRTEHLEREVQRLEADLHAAEAALVAAESGLRGRHSRAALGPKRCGRNRRCCVALGRRRHSRPPGRN